VKINSTDLDFTPSAFIKLNNILSSKELALISASNNVKFVKNKQDEVSQQNSDSDQKELIDSSSFHQKLNQNLNPTFPTFKKVSWNNLGQVIKDTNITDDICHLDPYGISRPDVTEFFRTLNLSNPTLDTSNVYNGRACEIPQQSVEMLDTYNEQNSRACESRSGAELVTGNSKVTTTGINACMGHNVQSKGPKTLVTGTINVPMVSMPTTDFSVVQNTTVSLDILTPSLSKDPLRVDCYQENPWTVVPRKKK
jgi:hypothetical protein